MLPQELPKDSADVLQIPPCDIPDVIDALVAQRALSSLVSSIHQNLWSDDPALKRQGAAALNHLGFPD